MDRPKLARPLLLATLLATSLAQAGFDPCKFNFGQSWEGPGATYATGSDYITIWIGDGDGVNTYNSYWEGDMLRSCKVGSGHPLAGKTPVLYSYIIPFLAKNTGDASLGKLKDCNVAGKNSAASLCVNGSQFIRNNRDLILSKYTEFSKGVATDYGTTAPVIWLLEPDFLQYHEATSYWGTQKNPLSLTESGDLIGDIIARVKANLPNARFSFDISPWLGAASWEASQREWLEAMPKSEFSLRNTSGGGTLGNNALIRSTSGNYATWAGVSQLSGMPLIADDGYGVGGATMTDWTEWLVAANVNARIADGVVALSVQNPGTTYDAKIAAIRSSLDKPACTDGAWTPAKPTFTLTASPGSNGDIRFSPPGGVYDSGSVVIATALPDSGYTFQEWGGMCSGTAPACTVTVFQDDAIVASFKQFPKLSVSRMGTGSGTVASIPAGIACGASCEANFAPGTSVSFSAVPDPGSVFAGWSYGCTGSGPCKISMDGSKNLMATFKAASNALKTFALATAADNGTILLAPTGGRYDSSTIVTLLARPDSGYGFSGWSGDCSGSDSVCSVAMSSAKSVTASFAPLALYHVVVLPVTGGRLNFLPAGPDYFDGTTVKVVALPDSGNERTAWTGACTGISDTCTFKVVRDSLMVGATFAKVVGIASGILPASRLTVSGRILHFDPSQLGPARLELFDTRGRRLRLWEGRSEAPLRISLQGLPAGLWFARLSGEGQPIHKLVQILR